MSIFSFLKPSVAVGAVLLGASLLAGAAAAAPLAPVKAAVDVAKAQDGVQQVRWRGHRHWGGFGLYIGPGYGYGYGYYPRYRRYYSYYPSYYDYDDYDYGYYRPYRYRSYYYGGHHSRRWVQHRFRHPLGVR